MKTAMILAAGRGLRLRPMTDHRPKALCLVNDIPLIEYHIKHLADAGFSDVVVNHAYLGSKIRHHLGTGATWGLKITYSPEPPGGLETGGGVVNALPLLGTEPFACINADIVTDYDFKTLHLPKQSQTHIVLVKKPETTRTGDFGMSDEALLLNEPKTHVYSGIACYHPDIFKSHSIGRYSLVPTLRALAEDKLATAEIYDGRWFDTGSIPRLEAVNRLSWG